MGEEADENLEWSIKRLGSPEATSRDAFIYLTRALELVEQGTEICRGKSGDYYDFRKISPCVGRKLVKRFPDDLLLQRTYETLAEECKKGASL